MTSLKFGLDTDTDDTDTDDTGEEVTDDSVKKFIVSQLACTTLFR